MPRLARALLPALALTLACVAACDETGRSEDRVHLLVVHAGGVGLPETFPGIEEVRVTAWNARTGAVVDERSFAADAGSRHALSDLPLDDDLVVFFEGLDRNGALRALGGSRRVHVGAQTAAAPLPSLVHMVPLDHFAPASAPFSGPGGELLIGAASFDDGPRAGHTATLLADGRVLVLGGAQLTAPGLGAGGTDLGAFLDTILVHDPHTGYFELARDRNGAPIQLATPRAYHTATRLPGNRVLVAGGLAPSAGSGVTTLRSVEIVQPDPEGGFERIDLDPMAVARAHHTATARLDGTVLLAGGEARDGDFVAGQSTAELFDPITNTFVPTQPMAVARAEHTATLLADGLSVLVAGGRDGEVVYATTELFALGADSTLRFTPTPAMSLPRYAHGAARLSGADGRYLVFAGGYTPVQAAGGESVLEPTAHFDLVDTFGGAFLAPGELARPRADFVFVPVGQGNELLAAGGVSVDAVGNREVLDIGERLIFDPARPDAWAMQDTENLLGAPRRDAAAVTLESGLVLVTGGADLAASHATSDLYNGGPPAETTAASRPDATDEEP